MSLYELPGMSLARLFATGVTEEPAVELNRKLELSFARHGEGLMTHLSPESALALAHVLSRTARMNGADEVRSVELAMAMMKGMGLATDGAGHA